jgi:hypothetical protein
MFSRGGTSLFHSEAVVSQAELIASQDIGP